MREKRNGLRPVTAEQFGETLTGYFHCFGQEGDVTEGIGVYATIELENGTIAQVDAFKMRFDDIERLGKED